ncbi:carbohydrate ABC transporter permease [Cohnella sp.]|uniref:carbohydrate ABC transporter permease n=1 Tax=Cohnella sp. TaxID=1883426 RepID=UPI003569A86C
MIQYLNFFKKPQGAAYLFILPALVILLVFTVIPLLATIVISVLDMDIFLKGASYSGMENFQKLLSDERYWNAMKNTFYFTFVQMPLQIMLALVVAVFVSTNTLFRKILRTAFFLPFVCSLTAIAIVWSFLLDPQTGLYTHYLHLIGLPRLEFLRDPELAMPTVILMTVWRNFGYSMIILMAGIQSIPKSYYEAAQIDGASKLKQFKNITIPMLIPALSFCVITTTISALQVFDQIFVTTQGGPLFRTETVVNYIYNTGFKLAPYDLGYASAISVSLMVVIMLITLSMNRYFLNNETSDVL